MPPILQSRDTVCSLTVWRLAPSSSTRRRCKPSSSSFKVRAKTVGTVETKIPEERQAKVWAGKPSPLNTYILFNSGHSISNDCGICGLPQSVLLILRPCLLHHLLGKMLQSRNNGQTNNRLQAYSATAVDECGLIHRPFLPQARPSLEPEESAAGGDFVPESDDDDAATISDDELVLEPSHLVRAVRFDGSWLFKVEYHNSSLSAAFFGQLLIANNRLSRLAENAGISGDQCLVKWRSEWIPLFEPELPGNYRALAKRINAVTAGEDEVRWYSHDSSYAVSGQDERHHMCLDSCRRCSNIAAVAIEGPVSSRSQPFEQQHLELMRSRNDNSRVDGSSMRLRRTIEIESRHSLCLRIVGGLF